MNKIIPFLLCTFCLASCDNYGYSDKNNMKVVTMQKANQEVTWRTGEVRYFEFEGGFYGILAANGDKLLPLKLSTECMQDGAIIEFRGQEIKDMMTTKQWGVVFEISESRLIKPGSPSRKPTH
jgi:hypothetical protein